MILSINHTETTGHLLGIPTDLLISYGLNDRGPDEIAIHIRTGDQEGIDRKPTADDLPIVAYLRNGGPQMFFPAGHSDIEWSSAWHAWETVTLSDPDDIAEPPTPSPKFDVGDLVQTVAGDNMDYVRTITAYEWDHKSGQWRYHAGTGYNAVESYLRPAEPDPDAKLLRFIADANDRLYPHEQSRLDQIADRLDAMRPGLR